MPVLDDVAGAPELASRYAVVAILTGETRKPMAGEWYIKGPVYGAWRACSQMIRSYPIAKLVTVVAVAELRVVDDGVKLAKVSA